MSLTVTYEDGRAEKLTAGPAQMVSFERQYKTGVGKAFAPVEEGGEGMRMEHIMFLAWKAAVADANRNNTGPVPLFDQWLETVTEVEVDADTAGGTADPLG